MVDAAVVAAVAADHATLVAAEGRVDLVRVRGRGRGRVAIQMPLFQVSGSRVRGRGRGRGRGRVAIQMPLFQVSSTAR